MTNIPPRTSSLLDAAPRIHPIHAATANRAGRDISRPASAAPKSNEAGKVGTDFLSDKATAAFIRRTLCAHHQLDGIARPIEDLLPPLTSSNEVDLQLYAIIAVVLKEFVYTWYAKITPDHVFVDEVIQIIAHCTRALEQRLRKIDLEALLLDEIPTLLDNHIKAFRTAHQSLVPSALATDPRQVYHTLNPHPALSPTPLKDEPETTLEQEKNEEVWRQLLVEAMLAVLLPTEDLENRCLRALVAEILSEMIIGKVLSNKVCEPWMMWELITTAVRVARPGQPKDQGLASAKTPSSEKKDVTTQLEQFGLLTSTAERQDQMRDDSTPHSRKQGPSAIQVASGHFWSIVSTVFLALTAVRAVVLALATSSRLPLRSETWPVATGRKPTESERQVTGNLDPGTTCRPLLSMRIWSVAGHLIELDLRMPWLAGFIAWMHNAFVVRLMRVGGSNAALDRILSNIVRTTLLSPGHIAPSLRLVRGIVFPANALGPARAIPSPDEVGRIRRRCAEGVVDALPPLVARRYFCPASSHGKEGEGWKDEAVGQAEGLIDVLGDAYLNRHLVFGILELVVVRLLPEVAEKGVEGLLGERGIGE